MLKPPHLAVPLEELPVDPHYVCTPWIETYTGKKFDSLRPRVEDVSVIDVAHHLSNQCRYSGAVAWFYSVAQHCCLLADYTAHVLKANSLDCLQILWHDAAEAYLQDIARPVKQFMPVYRQWDHAITVVTREWLGLTEIPVPAFQEEIDSRIIIDEKAILFPRSPNKWDSEGLLPLGIEIDRWTPEYAETQFLMRYTAWANSIHGSPQYIRQGWNNRPHPQAVYHATASDSGTIADVYEVDLRAGIGRVKLRSEDGMLIRDRDAGRPRPAWDWRHGTFEMITAGAA